MIFLLYYWWTSLDRHKFDFTANLYVTRNTYYTHPTVQDTVSRPLPRNFIYLFAGRQMAYIDGLQSIGHPTSLIDAGQGLPPKSISRSQCSTTNFADVQGFGICWRVMNRILVGGSPSARDVDS